MVGLDEIGVVLVNALVGLLGESRGRLGEDDGDVVAVVKSESGDPLESFGFTGLDFTEEDSRAAGVGGFGEQAGNGGFNDLPIVGGIDEFGAPLFLQEARVEHA